VINTKDHITREDRKQKALKAIYKMIEDKKSVRLYIKGEIDLKTIKERGIKFAKPI